MVLTKQISVFHCYSRKKGLKFSVIIFIASYIFVQYLFLFLQRFENVYLDDEIRVAKDIRGDYLIVERAPYNWKE